MLNVTLILLIKELKAPPKAKKKPSQPSDVDPEEREELELEVRNT